MNNNINTENHTTSTAIVPISPAYDEQRLRRFFIENNDLLLSLPRQQQDSTDHHQTCDDECEEQQRKNEHNRNCSLVASSNSHHHQDQNNNHDLLLHQILYFAKIIRKETAQRIRIVNTMNYIQSLGGGWASIKNSKKSRECARILSSLASVIGDEATIRKCKIFEGYALSWEGRRKDSSKLFQTVKAQAEREGDVENNGRCEHGMKSLLWDFDKEIPATAPREVVEKENRNNSK